MAIRSFLAFELPPAIRAILGGVLEEGRARSLSIRWVPVSNIHLTVVFMGDVEEESIDLIKEAVSVTCSRYTAFQMQAKGVGMFGSRRTPRVLWVGLTGDVQRMGSLRDDLQQGLALFGIQKERRAFRPHLTLGRFRKGAKADARLDDLLSRHEALSSPECVLRRLVLFKSDLKAGGSVYTQMGAWSLAG